MTPALALSLALLLSTSMAIAQTGSGGTASQTQPIPTGKEAADKTAPVTDTSATAQMDAPRQDGNKHNATGTEPTPAIGTASGTGAGGAAGVKGANGNAGAAGAGGGTAAGAGAIESNELPEFEILCVHVFDRYGTLATDTKNADPRLEKQPERGQVECPPPAWQTLIGAGDVVIVISPKSFDQLEAYQAKKGVRASLYINGVNLGTDADLVGVQRYVDRTVMQYNLLPGKNSKKLWAALYRAGRATTLHPLNAGLGFSSGPITYGTTAPSAQIAITNSLSFWTAIGVIAILVVFAGYQGSRTDIFRDAKSPEPFRRALVARRLLKSGKAAELEVLTELYPGFNTAEKDAYKLLARQVLENGEFKDIDLKKLSVGLVLVPDEWRSARPSYSLGRVQLGMWFLFAVAAGVFLSLIYGELPELDGSLLALLGLSVGVTGVSLAIDNSNPFVRFSPSQGLFKDLITSWDDQHQVYRFQAVVVNLLLLGVGIIHVSRHLTYPIFDATWLAFLGISGVALAAGKSVVETKPTLPAPPK